MRLQASFFICLLNFFDPKTNRTSDQKFRNLLLYPLSYRALSKKKQRVNGIEPSLSAWKAEVLPLNYTRKLHLYIIKIIVICQVFSMILLQNFESYFHWHNVFSMIYQIIKFIKILKKSLRNITMRKVTNRQPLSKKVLIGIKSRKFSRSRFWILFIPILQSIKMFWLILLCSLMTAFISETEWMCSL